MINSYFTKIIATLGPSTHSYEKIKSLIEKGVSVFRLNFSHGTHEDHKKSIEWIRQAEVDLGRVVGVIGDLQGPKFRLGKIKTETSTYKAGDIITLVPENSSHEKNELPFPHEEVFEKLKVNNELLIDDGKITLKIVKTEAKKLTVEVLAGGKILSGKGVNLPHLKTTGTFLTEKDQRDLRFALSLGVDYLALSFVQSSQDIKEVREVIKEINLGDPSLITKLEKPAAIQSLDEIIAKSDAVIIARGDLGVEIPCEKVPALQREIIHKCREKGVPVVVATQMLESMTESSMPTRAEVSDVATAVYEGADAVMLSAESAVGSYPIEAVDMMRRIVQQVEKDGSLYKAYESTRPVAKANDEDAISSAIYEISRTLEISAIACFTETGGTSKRTARQRSLVPILGITPHLQVARQLSLVWGVLPVYTEVTVSALEDFSLLALEVVSKASISEVGDKIIITAGVPFGQPGTTNLLRLLKVK